MNRFVNKGSVIPAIGLFLAMLVFLSSCEQNKYEPNTSVAPGGGTVTTYKSYTLTSATGSTVYGRVVFYKYSASVTMIEMGLYNTVSGTTYSSAIYEGKVADNSTKSLKTLDAITGATGGFATNKYFIINEAGFYDKLNTYNANVKVMLGTKVMASGNIGSNTLPVAQSQ
ncbi:hypothetical protein [Spirosoma linguale]|uniref:CHRD domain-containing protein n=1 Tax=Spirosoma linguale (strain ATCC 33905 / DSM 74 / LMG 10896 / Claus 1) TaxID=504472 RepID=D2QKC2_SPILD|nr:hypothetical protein Slin_2935 [Spirosoma linguale DSM 74]